MLLARHRNSVVDLAKILNQMYLLLFCILHSMMVIIGKYHSPTVGNRPKFAPTPRIASSEGSH
jgi:hypothetical protein